MTVLFRPSGLTVLVPRAMSQFSKFVSLVLLPRIELSNIFDYSLDLTNALNISEPHCIFELKGNK